MKHLVTEKYWCVKQLDIFHDLSEADIYALDRIISDKVLKHEERICEEGVYLIKDGRIKIAQEHSADSTEKSDNPSINSKSNEKAETQEVLEAGEIFGVFSDDDRYASAISELITYATCLSEVRIGVAKIRDFSFFVKRKPHLTLPLHRPTLLGTFLRDRHKQQEGLISSHNILNITKTANFKDYNTFSNIAFRTVSSRFALLLQNLASVPDNKGVLSAPRLSTKRFSKLIGTSTETMDKLLETFIRHQVIDKHWGRIQILNAWQLKKIADARMKTLMPMKEATVTPDNDLAPDDDFNLAAHINGHTQAL